MNTIRWRWVLSALQVVLTIAAFVYAPYEYRANPHPIGDCIGDQRAQVWPPVAERAALAISFPAYAAVVPIGHSHWSGELRYTYGRLDIFFDLQDLLFFGGVGLLWYWIGAKLDTRLNKSISPTRSQVSFLTLVALSLGVLFAIGVGVLAFELANSKLRPQIQVAPFGFVWSLILLAYFGSTLVVSVQHRR